MSWQAPAVGGGLLIDCLILVGIARCQRARDDRGVQDHRVCPTELSDETTTCSVLHTEESKLID